MKSNPCSRNSNLKPLPLIPISSVHSTCAAREQRHREKDLDTPAADPLAKLKEKNRGRGKNSALRRHLRKKGGKNVVDEKRMRLEEMRKEKVDRDKEKLKKDKIVLGPALARFAPGKRA